MLGNKFNTYNTKVSNKVQKEQYNQSGTIFIINIAFNIISRMSINLLGITYISYIIGLVQVVIFIFVIISVVKAFNNESYKIPVIYDLSQKIWK